MRRPSKLRDDARAPQLSEQVALQTGHGFAI